ncbi:hypothetical protein B0H17DRAFT_1128431 [Mycena rosella]|uniref:Uncharacterized protein n=1 Tax=Mycena rosella TaxID=1033263 RepID=A0AAD7GM49_MYCRO|nr:hypothetical protein B0H17DRAFT_1128431 [Mycena rosella]
MIKVYLASVLAAGFTTTALASTQGHDKIEIGRSEASALAPTWITNAPGCIPASPDEIQSHICNWRNTELKTRSRRVARCASPGCPGVGTRWLRASNLLETITCTQRRASPTAQSNSPVCHVHGSSQFAPGAASCTTNTTQVTGTINGYSSVNVMIGYTATADNGGARNVRLHDVHHHGKCRFSSYPLQNPDNALPQAKLKRMRKILVWQSYKLTEWSPNISCACDRIGYCRDGAPQGASHLCYAFAKGKLFY